MDPDLLTIYENGNYKFELPLTDEKNNVFVETILIRLMVMDTTYTLLRNIEDYEYIDIAFDIYCFPCQNFMRVHSFQTHFVGKKNSYEEWIYTEILNPSVVINYPDEEFYAALDPLEGFSSVDGVVQCFVFARIMKLR